MQKEIRVWETTETVTILASDTDGSYRITWHRTDGPVEEFHITPADDETVEEAIKKDLRNRLGP